MGNKKEIDAAAFPREDKTPLNVRVVGGSPDVSNNPAEALKDELSKEQNSIVGIVDPKAQGGEIQFNFSADSSQATDALAKVNESLGEVKPKSRAHVIIDRVPDAPVLTSIPYNDTTTEVAGFDHFFLDPAKSSFAVNADVAAAATSCLHCQQPKTAHSTTAQICVKCKQGIGGHTGNNKCRNGERADMKDTEFKEARCVDGTLPVFAFTVNPDSRVKLLSDVEAQKMLADIEVKKQAATT